MRLYQRIFLLIVRWLLNIFTLIISRFQDIDEKKTVPPITNPLLMISATKLAYKIRHKEIKSVDLIQAYIDRCIEVDPIINAIVETRYETSLMEAKHVDILIESGKFSAEELHKMYPLLGIPVTVKESIAVKDMINEAGRVNPNYIPAPDDAISIAWLKCAGAIVLLVSNTPELCMSIETINNVTGLTRNPYNTKMTSGGSSGGEGALLASGASLIGVGSDIGGSLRIPAMVNGVFGHLPTPRIVSVHGHKPYSESDDWKNCFSIGPMTRYAEDLPLLMSALESPHSPNPLIDQKVPINDIKIFYIKEDGSGVTNKVAPVIKNAMEKVIKHFSENRNMTVTEANPKNMKYSYSFCSRIFRIKGVTSIFPEPMKWSSILKESLKKIAGQSEAMLYSIAYGYLKKFYCSYSKDTYEIIDQRISDLKDEFADLLGNNGVCFYPTTTNIASLHTDFLRNVFGLNYTYVFNCIGLPATHCPLGLSPEGLPVGLQIFANPGCDHLLFTVAKELEEAFGGWAQPGFDDF